MLKLAPNLRPFFWKYGFVLSVFGTAQSCSLYDASLLEQAADAFGGRAPGSAKVVDDKSSAAGEGSSVGGANSLEQDADWPVTGDSKMNGAGGVETGSSSGGESGALGGAGGLDVVPVFDFAREQQGFFLSHVNTSGIGANSSSWVGLEGDPEPGAVLLSISFGGPSEDVFYSRQWGSAIDLKGAELRARVKLESGLSGNPSCLGGAYLFAKSTNDYVFARGPWQNLQVIDGWLSISMALDAPGWQDASNRPFDPSDVRELGVGVSSGGPECPDPEWREAQVYVDSIDY